MKTLKRETLQPDWALKVRTKVVSAQKDPRDKVGTESGERIGIEAGVEVGAGIGDAIGTARDRGAMATIDNTNIVIAHVRDIGKGKGRGIMMTEGTDDTKRSARGVHIEVRIDEVIAVAHDRPGQAVTRVERPDDTDD
jgi:hypothetical protein